MGGGGVAGVAAADLPRILNITVPQVGHLPLIALRPFFMVSSTPSEISFLALHLTQYPSAINYFSALTDVVNGKKTYPKQAEPSNLKEAWKDSFSSQQWLTLPKLADRTSPATWLVGNGYF